MTLCKTAKDLKANDHFVMHGGLLFPKFHGVGTTRHVREVYVEGENIRVVTKQCGEEYVMHKTRGIKVLN